MTKNRKQLPNFGYLQTKSVNIDAIINHMNKSKLLDPTLYNDIKVSANSKHRDFVIANEYSKNNFFKEETAETLEGESYVQLYLTDFDSTKKSSKVELKSTNIFSRTKRLNPTHRTYLAEADELNYGIRNELVTGIFEEILNMFESKITRVRLAYLKSNFSLKPHIDYDPSYIVRYHVPIITDEKCKMHVVRNGKEYSSHFSADGRIYFLNAGHLHWASNNSNIHRLHLIIDVHGQKELEYLNEFE